MKKYRVISNYAHLTDGELEQLGPVVLAAMTANTHYPDPDPTLIEVEVAHTAYAAALAKAATGSSLDRTIKTQKRETLEEVYHDLALYVNRRGHGDKAIVQSSGLPLWKDRDAHRRGPVILEKATGLSVATGHCMASMSLHKVEDAAAYLFECTKAPVTPASVWMHGVCAKPAFTFSGLETDTKYVFRAAGIGEDPNPVFSDEISAFVM